MDMCPVMGDHTVAILVLDAQRCHNRASVLQEQWWNMYCIHNALVIVNFFCPFKWAFPVHLHWMQKIRINGVKSCLVCIPSSFLFLLFSSFFFLFCNHVSTTLW
jgi:hypothetical protein